MSILGNALAPLATIAVALVTTVCGCADDAAAAAAAPAQAPTPTALPTAGDQAGNPQDLAITAAVRQDIIAHKGLSIAAQNVTIVTRAGVVTVRGRVDSASERDAIVALAGKAAGATAVIDRLEPPAP